ncbi:serine protease inhibitor 3/4-like isoform X5 [Rhynchophorus ferrugineus]|uniref:serine protease inhibitor 3/4-like isoform X5 n=1 Tax=Rhynchophorus ferrugineus TaxID=354439 RepID=UPI003FCDC23E
MKHILASVLAFQLKADQSVLVRFGILFIFVLLHLTMASKEELQTVIQGNGLFTKQLYSVLAKKEGNVFFSPISVHAVLSMAYQGAGGSTYEALTNSLNVPNHSIAAKGYNSVLGQLNNVSGIELSMANKIYIKEGYELQSEFQEVTAKQFLSAVEPVNFNESEKAAKTINTWVEEKTKEKIKDLVKAEDLNEDTRLVLLNAIYFKGNWASKFDAAETRPQKFYINNNDSIEVQMMKKKSKYNYKEDRTLDAQVLELPYSNPDISMIIILPNKRDGIVKLEEKLANVDLTKITENMYKPEVIVSLPKFKIETEIDLNGPLQELGLGEIFNQKSADFSKMLKTPEQLVVSKVVQKAFIEVNEEGAEAAAATMVSICYTISVGVYQPVFEFIADHPFVVFLTANTKEIKGVLFAGRISKPIN